MSKHTPGPWRVQASRLTLNDRCCPWIEAESEPYEAWGNKGLRTVCRIEGSTLGNREANARLIAAAPAMYEAITLMLEAEQFRMSRLEECEDFADLRENADILRDRAIAAMRKIQQEVECG